MTGRNVPLSESVDGHLHAAGHRADKVGELSDTKVVTSLAYAVNLNLDT